MRINTNTKQKNNSSKHHHNNKKAKQQRLPQPSSVSKILLLLHVTFGLMDCLAPKSKMPVEKFLQLNVSSLLNTNARILAFEHNIRKKQRSTQIVEQTFKRLPDFQC